MDQIDLGQFPEVIEDLIRGYLTQEIDILELGKLGDLSFPNPDSELEKDFDIKLPEFMETSIFSRNWKLIRKIDTEKVLIVCNPRKYTFKNEINTDFKSVKRGIYHHLHSILAYNNLKCKKCKSGEFKNDIYIKFNITIEELKLHLNAEIDEFYFMQSIGEQMEFLCEKCLPKTSKSKYSPLGETQNKRFHLSKNFRTIKNTYICMQMIRLNSERFFPGYIETILALDNGTKFIQTYKNNFEKIDSDLIVKIHSLGLWE